MRERAHVVSSAESTTTDYAWTGAQLAAMRVTHAIETSGGVETTVTDYRFVYGPDSLPLEMIVTPGGGTPVSYAFQCDRAGSVVALTDSTGAVVASYAYDPYGRLLATGGSDPALAGANPLRYRGYCYDEATGHYYLPARYYDPATARFLSVDPAPPVAGDPLSLNRYAYCVGDPINASDPSGAVTDVEYDSWRHYYYDDPSTAGNRQEARKETKKVRRPVSKARGAFNSQAPSGYSTTTYDVVTVVGGDQVAVGPGSLVEPESKGADSTTTMATVLHTAFGPGTSLLVWGIGQMAAGAWLMVAGAEAGIAGTVAIPVTAGLGSGLTIAGGAAMIGGFHVFAAGAGCFYAGGIDMGWWGQ